MRFHLDSVELTHYSQTECSIPVYFVIFQRKGLEEIGEYLFLVTDDQSGIVFEAFCQTTDHLHLVVEFLLQIEVVLDCWPQLFEEGVEGSLQHLVKRRDDISQHFKDVFSDILDIVQFFIILSFALVLQDQQ